MLISPFCRSLLKDNVEDLAGADAEVSLAHSPVLSLCTCDLDHMDADFLGLKKSKPPSKGSEKEAPGNPRPVSTLTASEKGDTIPNKKPPPSLSRFGRQYKRFSFEDMEDPLAGLLSDEEEEEPAKKPPVTESRTASNKSPSVGPGQGPSVPLTPGDTPVRKKEELQFDDTDDFMATLGFEDSPKADKKKSTDKDGPLPARSKLDELLGRGTSAKLLARPGTGEQREFKLDKKYQNSGESNPAISDKEDSWDDEILTFGAYQPTMASSEGRQSRRQSVSRFLGEGGPDPKGELSSKQNPPVSSSPINPKKGGADWLGLKDDDLDLLPPSPKKEVQQEGSAITTPSLPPPASQHSAPGPHSTSAAKPPAKDAGPPAKASQAPMLTTSEETKGEEGDWLSHVLSQKKSQGLAREERAVPSLGPNSVGTLDRPSPGSQPAASTHVLEQATAGEAWRAPTREIPATRKGTTGLPMSWSQASSALPAGDPKRGIASGDFSSVEPAICVSRAQESMGLCAPVQPLRPEDLMPSALPGAGYQKQLQVTQEQLQSSNAQLQAELLRSQMRLSELEAQVRKLDLERTQHKLLLESLQQRHQADLELIENAHRNSMKVLETSYQQREEQLQKEKEALSAQYLSHCREAEQARVELIAQHQRRLAMAAQEKDQEVARLQELQQASILEMRKDHEEQLQRLKLLKDQEINAVTSATSHTRSLNGIIEQMEKFSSSLSALSSRVEASHLTTTQERELGIRQQDEQLRGSPLCNLGPLVRRRTNREDWNSLEEQRKVMVQQISMEREELERAKVSAAPLAAADTTIMPRDTHSVGHFPTQSALLEEQKSVMHKCGEERRRLATEWAEYFTQQKLSKERAEREVERALQADAQREGTLLSLAKEQAELTVRARELRNREEKLAAEKEAVEREWRELRLEKDRVHNAAMRLQTRVQEVEHMSKVSLNRSLTQQLVLQVASEKYEEAQQPAVPNESLSRAWGQEHLSLAQQRLELDRVRQDLPSTFPGKLFKAQGLTASNMDGKQLPPQCSKTEAASISAPFLAKLLLLKHTAQQDRDFLENEQYFLETLKKASYNMPSHSA
uniref:Fas binding factor 1 n=1 Tax=Jaculus jaculus TaxID=51337 RepID=A0A8C5KHX1_JACJA